MSPKYLFILLLSFAPLATSLAAERSTHIASIGQVKSQPFEGSKQHEKIKTALRSIASIEPELEVLIIEKISFPPLTVIVD